jgi:hypothetical protein
VSNPDTNNTIVPGLKSFGLDPNQIISKSKIAKHYATFGELSLGGEHFFGLGTTRPSKNAGKV